MSYFGLMTLFPALLLLLALSNKIAAGSQMLAQAVDVYPGSGKFLRDTILSFSELGLGALITCSGVAKNRSAYSANASDTTNNNEPTATWAVTMCVWSQPPS